MTQATTTTNAPQPQIDRQRFEQVTARLGAAHFLALFFEQAQLMLATLHDATMPERAKEWRDAAHKVKGAALTLGLSTMAELLKEAQHAADKDEAVKRELIERIETELDLLHTYFRFTLKPDTPDNA